MEAPIAYRTYYVEGESIESWSALPSAFSCQPSDIRRYIDGGRWDLVFNALCYLTGVVEEGSA